MLLSGFVVVKRCRGDLYVSGERDLLGRRAELQFLTNDVVGSMLARCFDTDGVFPRLHQFSAVVFAIPL